MHYPQPFWAALQLQGLHSNKLSGTSARCCADPVQAQAATLAFLFLDTSHVITNHPTMPMLIVTPILAW